MDDDGQPEPQTLEILLGKAAANGLRAICPVIVGNGNLVQGYHHKNFDVLGREVSPFKSGAKFEDLSPALVKEMANAFVGPLVHRNVLEKIGLPIKEYFIWGDDTDYTLRIGKAFDLYVYTGAVIHHHDGNYAFSKALDPAQYWKVYYAVRNRLWIRRLHFGILPNIFAFVWASLAAMDPKIDSKLRSKKIRGLVQGLGRIPAVARPEFH
jgi:GT2 family glycosyltransferase